MNDKYSNGGLWDMIESMDFLTVEELKSQIFNYFSSDGIEGFIEHLKTEYDM